MGHTDPLKQARATPGEQQQQKPKASINKMQHIRRMQHLCGIYCEPRERNRGRVSEGASNSTLPTWSVQSIYAANCCILCGILAHFVERQMANGLRLYQSGCAKGEVGRGGVRCTVIGCPNKALCKRWRSLIAICLNVCYTIFQRLTLCNPSSYPTHSPPLSLHPFHSLLLSAVA